jgi:P27 family predicted phage terminase small subunit
MAGVPGRSGGRNAKPVQVHQLHGTFRADRHEGIEHPAPPSSAPESPIQLTGEAKAEWTRMVDRLSTSKVLTKVDDAALYQYVQLFAETEAIKADNAKIRKLSADLKRAIRELEGVELVQAVGEVVKLQQVLAKQTTQLRQGHMAIRQYLVEFGLTPAARSRVRVADDKEKPKSALETLQAQRPALSRVK